MRVIVPVIIMARLFLATALGQITETTFTLSNANVNIFHDTLANQQVDTFSTRLIARTANNVVLYDQTFSVAFSDPAFQAAISSATTLLLSGGALAVAGPTLTASSTTLTNTSVQTVVNNTVAMDPILSVTETVGPKTIMIGDFGTCQSYTMDSPGHYVVAGCSLNGMSFVIPNGTINYDALSIIVSDVYRTVTTTKTYLISRTYELVGVSEACRTQGYWSTHAGYENKNSTNQTDTTLAKAPGGSINICGQPIYGGFGATSTAGVDHQSSPVEAMCSVTSSDYRNQLVSQLTAASLNCAANGFAPDCSNSPTFASAVAACNTQPTCAPTSGANKDAQSLCVSMLSCLNSGGKPGFDANNRFFCASGTCSDNGALCTASDLSQCGAPASAKCVAAPNCQTLSFADPLLRESPAGSSKACNDASKTTCNIFGGCKSVP